MQATIYTGTTEDHELLLAEDHLDPEDTFDVLSVAEVRNRLMKSAVEKPSLLRRLVGWLT